MTPAERRAVLVRKPFAKVLWIVLMVAFSLLCATIAFLGVATFLNGSSIDWVYNGVFAALTLLAWIFVWAIWRLNGWVRWILWVIAVPFNVWVWAFSTAWTDSGWYLPLLKWPNDAFFIIPALVLALLAFAYAWVYRQLRTTVSSQQGPASKPQG